MKLFLFALLLAPVSHASRSFTYDGDAVGLMNAVAHCPESGDTLSDLLKQSDFISSATYSSPRPTNPKVSVAKHSIYGSKGGATETMPAQEVAVLSVTVTTDSTGVPADAKAKVDYRCLIKKLP